MLYQVIVVVWFEKWGIVVIIVSSEMVVSFCKYGNIVIRLILEEVVTSDK